MEMGGYSFEPRLERASTIPSRWYVDPEVLEAEYRTVFARTWQLVGRADRAAAPGDRFAGVVGREPVLVVRDGEGRLRAFSNVCRHRAGPIVDAPGTGRTLRCGYHGWTYDLDGRLVNAPEFEGVERFDASECRLPEYRVDEWAGLVFVNLDPEAAPLVEALEDLPDRVPHADLTEFRPAFRRDWYLDCNWKVYVDNYLEGYHIPVVHPGLNREIDYAGYRTETRSLYSIQHSPIRSGAERLSSDGEAPEAQFYWLFPNLMLNVYPDNYSTNLIVPLGPERTLTVFEWFFRDPSDDARRRALESTVAFSDEIQIEDIRICEAVQRGLRSATYDRGRYSPARENGVHHFHGLLAKFLPN
jgi:choline monooxygenase